MTSIKDEFQNIQSPGNQRRLDPEHILDFYYGISYLGQKEFFLISPVKPPACESTGSIDVELGVRQDKQYVITFRLVKDEFADMFYAFCDDIVNYTRSLTDVNRGPKMVVTRYKAWQKMLRVNSGGLLSFEAIKGLAGELYFMKEFLFPLKGIAVSVNSWVGPEGADQDFRTDECWYEIKTTTPGNDLIQISSSEQLDVRDPGELIVLFADKTSEQDEGGVSLFSLFRSINNEIEADGDPGIKDRFWNLLSQSGFAPMEKYNEIRFRFTDTRRFTVDASFPCIRKINLPESVTEVTYKLVLNTLDDFEIK